MGRLNRGLLRSVVIVVFVIGGCGPTAQVITRPTPSPSGTPEPIVSPVPSTGEQPSNPPVQGSPTAGLSSPSIPAPTPTGIPLTTDTPPTPSGGTPWQPVDGFPSGAAIEVRSVIWTTSGFVAVGYEPMPGEGAYGRHQGLVWRSADGLSWADTAEPAFQLVTPEKILALGDSLFVLGTLSNCPDPSDDTCVEPPEAGWAVWRSTSGAPWERLPQLPSMQSGIVDGIVTGHDQLAAFGGVGDGDSTSTAWFSTDGANWTESTDLAVWNQIGTMTEAPTGFSAFGRQFVPDIQDSEVRAALTTDYSHFTPATAPAYRGGITVEDATSGSSGMVAVGYGTPDTGLVSVALYSADGAAWTEATDSDGSLTGGALSTVHALAGGGFVGLGFTPETDEFGQQVGQSWFSPDGQAWRHIAPIGGTFDQLETSALGPPGLVVFTVVQVEVGDNDVTSTISVWFAPADQLAAL